MFGRVTITLGIGPHSGLYSAFKPVFCRRQKPTVLCWARKYNIRCSHSLWLSVMSVNSVIMDENSELVFAASYICIARRRQHLQELLTVKYCGRRCQT